MLMNICADQYERVPAARAFFVGPRSVKAINVKGAFGKDAPAERFA